MIKRSLEIVGLQDSDFSEAENSVEALEILKDSEFDLVCTDLNMPEMDGTQLLKRIKNSPKLTDTPVIIISSLTNATREKQLLSDHALKVFKKPLSLPEFSGFFSVYLN
ncbi:response regulator [candidate division KSB1 bacterium]|nr:response regulator [candidate division KSB1 bacterium]